MGMNTKVIEGRFLNAVATVPEIDRVEIHAQDVIFGESRLYPTGEDHLLNFPRERLLLGE